MAVILVAEDELRILRVCQMWLSSRGHRVVEACNGAEAQRLLQSEQIDLLISDVDMPVLGGVALVRWWRDQRGSSAPVVMFTASTALEVVAAEMRGYGVVVMSKPFSPGTLVRTVNTLLQKSTGTGAAACRPPAGESVEDC